MQFTIPNSTKNIEILRHKILQLQTDLSIQQKQITSKLHGHQSFEKSQELISNKLNMSLTPTDVSQLHKSQNIKNELFQNKIVSRRKQQNYEEQIKNLEYEKNQKLNQLQLEYEQRKHKIIQDYDQKIKQITIQGLLKSQKKVRFDFSHKFKTEYY